LEARLRDSLALRLDPHDRRAQPRHTTPIRINILGETVACLNWSLSGFSVSGFAAKMSHGDTVAGTLEVGQATGSFAARVVRVDAEDGELGAQFIELDPGVYGAMLRLSRR
jgi:hypothetical protein